MRIIPLVLLSSLSLIDAAQAEEGVRKMLHDYDKGTLVEQNIMAANLNLIEMGMAYANAELSNHNQTPLYCTPVHLSLTGQQLVDILKHQVEDTTAVGNLPVGAVMIAALKKVFPCPQ